MGNTISRAARCSIGPLSRRTGVNVETIRYYERIGLMPKPPRTMGGHRSYDAGHQRRLAFIRRCRELGFPLGRVRDLLALAEGGRSTCDEVKAMTVVHIQDIRGRIADLRRMERVLVEMAAKCEGGDVPACPILEALAS